VKRGAPTGNSRGRKPGGPHPVDIQVGAGVRLRRSMLGLSQEKLGDAIGLTFQQVQKYERGTNRISASVLHALSRILAVPVAFFFDDTDPVRAPAIPADWANPRLRPSRPISCDGAKRSNSSAPTLLSRTRRCDAGSSISPLHWPSINEAGGDPE
jgi:transcriptional regulator with XRE-family HTH domain